MKKERKKNKFYIYGKELLSWQPVQPVLIPAVINLVPTNAVLAKPLHIVELNVRQPIGCITRRSALDTYAR